MTYTLYSPYCEDTFFAMLYQDALSLPVLHNRFPSTEKILFALRPFYKQSQKWMTRTKKVQMHKDGMCAQKKSECMHQMEYVQKMTNAQSITASDLARKK